MKDWFKARNIWGAAIQTLSDAEAGRLMKALWDYTMNGNQQNLSGAEKGIYALILTTLCQDEERDAEISEKRAVAGAIGGKQKVANASKCLANVANATNKNKNKNIDIKETLLTECKEKPQRFIPPTVEEVAAYCQQRGNSVNPQMFVDFYSAKGWKVGKDTMKDWRACVRTWEQRSAPAKKVVAQEFKQRDYQDVDAEIMASLARELSNE